ncbi:MAG: guanylate kinase [Lachnospiraceae bacterium]|nr:guanylate kinase [Lachnospiraceae bacterium]MDD6858457.1 guanylate kinase [Lachnospiraceae bacterium]
MLYVIMGKSSSGKDTIYRKLMEDNELKLNKIITYTTRPARAGEVEGNEYHFVDEAKMNEMDINGKIIEKRAYDTVYGVWNYFTADDENVKIDRNNYMVIGTLDSYEQLRAYYGEKKVMPIYIEVEDGERLARALEREREQDEPKYSEMCRRYLADEQDFNAERLEKLGIKRKYFNNDIQQCMSQIKEQILMTSD